MAPGLNPDDWVLVDAACAELGCFGVGDIVLLRAPDRHAGPLLVRIVAEEGDALELRGDELRINGQALAQWNQAVSDDGLLRGIASAEGMAPVPVQQRSDALRSARSERLEVPKGHVYVLGDSLSESWDSRSFGPVPRADVVGVVRLVLRSAEPERGLIGAWLRLPG